MKIGNKVYIAGLIFIVAGFLSAQTTVYDESAYPPNGWTQSFEKALERAAAEDKMILLNFTGSDWCSWCDKLEAGVFSQSEFLEWADENLILVFLDFPSSITQSDELVQQNQILSQFFGVRGYPSIILLDSDGTPLLQTGYQDLTAEGYIYHLQENWISLDEAVLADYHSKVDSILEEYLKPLGIE